MNSELLSITAISDQCKASIESGSPSFPGLAKSLQPSHLAWMCYQIQKNVEKWPVTKLHRWLGFIQCGMIAQGILDLNGARIMYDKAQIEYGDTNDDLLDHLDPTNSFEVDLGGEH